MEFFTSPINVVLFLLALAGVWAIVELALTFRKLRGSVNETIRSTNEVIAEVQPIVAKLDGVVDDLQPTIRELTPLVEKIEGTVDATTATVNSLNGVVGHVSTVSGTASNATEAVNKVVGNVAESAAGLVGKIGAGKAPRRVAAPTSSELPAEASSEKAPSEPAASEDERYVTISTVTADDAAAEG